MRVFIAINFPSEIKSGLSDFVSDLRDKFSNIRWVSGENVHLTLKFLGEVSESDLENVYLSCQNAVSDIAPFRFSCGGLGVFPRVIWLGISSGEKELKNLVCRLEDNLAGHGFPKEKRDYKPHLTLGRVKSPCDLGQYRNFKLGEIFVDKICVIKSVLSSKGAEHCVLKEFYLKKEGSKK